MEGPASFSLALAPMEGVTTLPFRLWLSLFAPPKAMTTPFLRATATYPHRELADTFAPELRPELASELPYELRAQIMASSEDDFLRAADFCLKAGASAVELNAGCPSPTCTGKGAGSSLLRDPEIFKEFVVRLAGGLGPSRLAVKMRTGFDDHAEFESLLAKLSALPLSRLTIHGRTRPQGYKGKARWDLIETAARCAAAPVIGSGDIVDVRSLSELARVAPSASGALVGRGVLRNPWIFSELERGEPEEIPLNMIAPMLTSFALLQDLYAREPESLVDLIRQGRFRRPLPLDPEAWQGWLNGVAAALPRIAHAPTEVPERATLGRVKMLWSYWRSSLPARFFAPETLRAATLGALLERLDALIRTHTGATGERSYVPRHAAELDWIYAGERRERVPPPAQSPSEMCHV